MNFDGTIESSEGILNSSNIPFTTLLNIPLGIGNTPIQNANSSMLTPPPTSDIAPRIGNNSFDTRSATATPTTLSAAHVDSLSAYQNLTAGGILQTPECYGIINSLIRRHQLETPPTPTIQPASDSVLSLWSNGIYDDYLGIINIIRQQQQISSPSFSHANNGSSVRSLWQSGISEDDGIRNRSVSKNQSHSLGSQEHYAIPSTLANAHISFASQASSSPLSKERHLNTSVTSSSSKSQSKRNAYATSFASCSPKSPNRGISHTTSLTSFSQKSPGLGNNISSISPKTTKKTPSSSDISLCSQKNPKKCDEKSSLNSIPSSTYLPNRLSGSEALSSNMCILSSTGSPPGTELASTFNVSKANEILPEKIIIASTSSSLPSSEIKEVFDSGYDLLSNGLAERTSNMNSDAKPGPLGIPVLSNVSREIPSEHSSQPSNAEEPATTDVSTSSENKIGASLNTSKTYSGGSDEHKSCFRLPVCQDVNSNTERCSSNTNSFNEEKIDVWSVKDSLLLKIVEPHVGAKDNNDLEPSKDTDDIEPGSPQLLSHLGSHCSRSVPSLMKFYSRHKRSLNSSLSINLAVSGQATPPCSPISPGTHYANTLQFSTSGALPVLSPSSFTQSNNIANISSPSSNSLNFQRSNQISPHNELHVTISTDDQALIPISKHVTSNTNSVLTTSLTTPLNILPSANTKKLSFEASTMTSPTEKSIISLPTSSALRGVDYNTSTRHCYATTTSTTQVNDTNKTRLSPIAALTLLTVPTVAPNSMYSPVTSPSHAKLSSPPMQPAKKLKVEENDQSAFTHVNLSIPLNHSMSLSVPTRTTSSLRPVHNGMPYSSPWSIPHNPLPHPGSYWMPPPSQFSGGDAGIGAASLGLGYHVTRDHLTGQLYLWPRPHPLSDPSGHGLMWTGYGSMAASPVVMTPQQLLLGDPHYGHAIHSSLMHLHHPSSPILSSPSKKVESPSMIIEDKKSHSPIGASHTPTASELPLPQPLATQHFMFPPTTLPYYCPQPPPSHPSHYSLSGYPHVPNPTLGMPTNLIQALTTTPFTTSTPTLTTAAAILAPLTVTPSFSNVKISSSASSSVWSRGSDIPISSPGLHYEPLSNRNADVYNDPPMDLTQRSKSPQTMKIDTEAEKYEVDKSMSQHVSKTGVMSHKIKKPLVIKKEIKEEVLSPPLTVNSEEEFNRESKTKPNFKCELGGTFCNVDNDSVSGLEAENFDAMLCPQQNLDLVLDLTNNDKQSSEKSDYKETSTSKNEIDSSGLELLLQTMFPTEKHHLAASPILDIDSNSSHSEQMPHLERAAKTPSPRSSPCSYESLPPVLTPFAPIPTILVDSPDYQHTSSINITSFEELRSDEPVGLPSHQPPKSNCFSFLCALAEQRILEEQQDNCSALSSLADVALSTPDLPIFEATDETIDESLIKENVNVNDHLTASTSFSEIISPMDIPVQEKVADINRNYKSPESQREVKAFIANKVSQYNKEFVNDANLPNYQNQIEEMDPAEVDMRMKLAAIQKKYKEKQHELSKLLPRKDSFSPSKRGRGRPPKAKLISTSPGIKRKVGRPQKKLSETLSDPKEDENCFKFENDPDICSNEPNSDSKTFVPLQINLLQDLTHDTLELSKVEQVSEDADLPSDCMDPLFKPPSVHLTEVRHEDSDDDVMSETSSKRDHIHLHAETSVESSTSDAEIHLSSSKKRKPGRPKKHSPTKYDATETIVAKKSKSLGFLLLQKSKIKPKLKAELKIRDSDEEEDEDNDFHHHSSKCAEASIENQEEINPKLQKTSSHCKGTNSSHKQLSLNIQHHGAPRGRTSLSRNTILRDKEKRKSTFEKNSQMQQLFRSLKRHSKVADPEHDESGDEREDNSDEEELDSKECITSNCNFEVNTKDFDQCSLPNSIPNSCQVTTQDTAEPIVEVKQEEENCETTLGENTTLHKPIMENIKLEDDAKADNYENELASANPEKEKDISICTLQVEDLVRGARVLVLQDGLLYAGNLMPITPPDVYGVHIDGERGTRPHICCQEELLTQSWKEVKPGSTRFLTEGTRVCAFWSQQYRGLYPGCVAAASSPSHEGNHNLVNVEFDDGDSGRIHVDDIRLLPDDFPVIEYDPNPLVTMNKRKRRPTEEDNSEFKTTEGTNKKVNINDTETPTSKVKKGNNKKKETLCVPSKDEREDMNVVNCDALKVKIEMKALMSPNPTSSGDIRTASLSGDELDHFNVDDTLCNKKVDVHKWATENFLLDTKSSYNKSIKRRRALSLSSSGKKHKKRHHSDTHKHRRKHKKRRRTLEDSWLHPHIEQGDNELKMRIRSPPPHQEESVVVPHLECNESSSSDDEEPTKEMQSKVSRKPQRCLKRSPSEKSKIAPFLPEQQLWKWSGKGYKRPGGKGKGKKEFYKEIVRGNERIRVGDCAVFLSSGSPDRPFIGKIDFLWEGWGGNMVVKVRWFYHPDETKEAERKLADPRDALFSSSHTDENDVQTISHKCEVVPLADYKLKRAELDERKDTESESNDDLYYLAGFYDTTHERITMEPGVS